MATAFMEHLPVGARLSGFNRVDANLECPPGQNRTGGSTQRTRAILLRFLAKARRVPFDTQLFGIFSVRDGLPCYEASDARQAKFHTWCIF